jgi:creatinine amidohydrolase/Fe(II)-dependent formamide hydrolase-like protein
MDPHLSLHTDGEISLGMARKLHRALCQSQNEMPLIIAENIALGEGPTMGPGSIHTPYKDLKKIILRTSKSLLRQGVKKVIFMTFHGGPMHNMAIHDGINFLQANGVQAINPFNLILHKMLNFTPENYEGIRPFLPETCDKDQVINQFNSDFHAGIFETSLCLYLCPETVGYNYKNVPHCPPIVSIDFS